MQACGYDDRVVILFIIIIHVDILVSIGRRLQDPLAELIKIEPKHLGIGMYQVREKRPRYDGILFT